MREQTSLLVELGDTLPAAAAAPETLAVGVFSDGERLPATRALGGDLRALCERVTADGEFDGEAETTLLIHASGAKARRMREVAARAACSSSGLARAETSTRPRCAARSAAAVRAAAQARTRAAPLVVPRTDGGVEVGRGVRALAEGAHLGLYENGFYQKKDEDEAPRLERLTLVGARRRRASSREELERARIVAESVNWARTLADEPGLRPAAARVRAPRGRDGARSSA